MLLSPRACLPILFYFFLRDALSYPLLRSLFPFPRNFSFLARAIAAPLNWIFPISFTSYYIRCHSTYGCQRSREFSPSTSHFTRQRQPCVRTFFSNDGFLRSVRVDFFLIRTRIRVHLPCIKVSSRSSGFFYDNVPGYFRVYLSTTLFSPGFIVLTCISTRYQLAHHIFSYHFTCHPVRFPSNTLSLLPLL